MVGGTAESVRASSSLMAEILALWKALDYFFSKSLLLSHTTCNWLKL